MVFMSIYFFFYNLQDYLYNIFNNYYIYNIFFSRKYIKKSDSNNSNYSNDSQDFYYFDLKETTNNCSYNYNIVCKKCKSIINNEIYLFNDFYFCSKFCRKHYSYKI